MILIGIDDTDVEGSKGTNQLAKAIVSELASEWKCERIVRHQLLQDKRIPCTSRNGCASILLNARGAAGTDEEQLILLIHQVREVMKKWYIKGSDPGLCVCPCENVSNSIVEFGYRCQFEVVTQADALAVADEAQVHLEGLGGSNGGLIGALAAVGLGHRGNDGRVVQIGEWSEDLVGCQTISAIQSRGVKVNNINTDEWLSDGLVELNKKLRPNLRGNEIVLFVQKQELQQNESISQEPTYQAIRLP